MCHYNIIFNSLPSSPPLFPSYFDDRGTNGKRRMLSGHTYWTRERRGHKFMFNVEYTVLFKVGHAKLALQMWED